jgi:hypothetical protein
MYVPILPSDRGQAPATRLMEAQELLSGFYTPGVAGYRLRPDNLNTTDFTNNQMVGVGPPVSGIAPPLLNQQGGMWPPIRTGSYDGENCTAWDPRASPLGTK